MSTYKGKPVVVAATPESISEKFADLTVLQSNIDALPHAEREMLGQARFEKDAIVIVNPQVGEMRFNVVERDNSHIKMAAEGMLPMSMLVSLSPVGDSSTEVSTSIDIQLPAMLKPFLGPQIQKAADQFGVMMGKIASGQGI